MIDFTRSELTQFVIHYVGNKGLGEELTLSEKEIKKYSLVKTGDLFKKDDYLLLYDDQYVKIGDSSILFKHKVIKENTVYRRK